MDAESSRDFLEFRSGAWKVVGKPLIAESCLNLAVVVCSISLGSISVVGLSCRGSTGDLIVAEFLARDTLLLLILLRSIDGRVDG